MRKILMLFLLASAPQPALAYGQSAQEISQMLTAQDWVFETLDKRPDGKPVCTEQWHFGSDRVRTVLSGEEVTTGHYTVRIDDDLYPWVDLVSVSTYGKEDCMGYTSRPEDYADKKNSVMLLLRNNGNMAACNAPTPMPDVIVDGKPVKAQKDNCYALMFKMD